jgi:hypothetical protein
MIQLLAELLTIATMLVVGAIVGIIFTALIEGKK